MNEERKRRGKKIVWNVVNSWWIILILIASSRFVSWGIAYWRVPEGYLVNLARTVLRSNLVFILIYPICWGIIYLRCMDRLTGYLFAVSCFLFLNLDLLLIYQRIGRAGSLKLIAIVAMVTTIFNATTAIVAWRPIMKRLAYCSSVAADTDKKRQEQVYRETACKELKQ